MSRPVPSPLDFFGRLRWIDGRPLLSTMESYRRELHQRALFTFRPDGSPLYNFVLSGRAKKNNKTTDLLLAAFYRLVMWRTPAGNDCYILANDEGQAADDLALAKKLVAANPPLAGELDVLAKEIRRKDGRGTMQILPSRDVAGAHGKTAIFLGFDEIHGYRSHDIFEALALDPSRADAMMWITSYDALVRTPGIPIVDFKAAGQANADPRMLFSWYSAELCTDPSFASLPPEERANPSMHSWPEGRGYLDQQRRRLPAHRFRRLHLNLPGAPDGAFYDGDVVTKAIPARVTVRPPQPGIHYTAFVDMSGGSSDDAVLGIAHRDPDPLASRKYVLDLVASQDCPAPFDPRAAVTKFVAILQRYGIRTITGDAYAGQTFRMDFEAKGIRYLVSDKSKSTIYSDLEPALNAHEVSLLDNSTMVDQMLGLVMRGGARIDHQSGQHDDWINAAAGALVLVLSGGVEDEAPGGVMKISFGPGGFKLVGVGDDDPVNYKARRHDPEWIKQYLHNPDEASPNG